MADMNQIVRVAVDNYHGRVTKYSTAEANELLYEALKEANGGTTEISMKRIRDGKCNGVFALVEEILANTVVEGLQENDFFMTMVDFRNRALGDQTEFVVEDSELFEIAEAAEGTQGIRRQRIGNSQKLSIGTTLHVVKVYEELNRLLAHRSDWNTFIAKVAKSQANNLLEDVYKLWSTATAADLGGTTFFPAAGSYSETALLDLIEHVEAAAGGKKATIIGTKAALRPLVNSQGADSYKEDVYNMGYAGKFYGTDMVAMPQRHKINSKQFLFDNTLHIIAGDDKPIKCVYEGDPMIITGDPLRNADLTQDALYCERYGMGLIVNTNTGIGRYKVQ